MKTQFDLFNKKNNKKILLGNGYRDVEGGSYCAPTSPLSHSYLFDQPGGGFGDDGHLMDEANSIRRSSQMVDSYLNIGSNTLSELHSQRSRFKVFTHSLTYLLTYSLTHSLIRSVTYLLIHLFVHWFTHSLIILGYSVESVGHAELPRDVE